MGTTKGHLTDPVSLWCPCGVMVASGHTFVNELDHVLGIADEAERNKTFKQFQEWDANVHGAIQVLLLRGTL